ncbi:MAG: ATP-binding protein [Verrucomicrobiota bacterium]
MTAPPERKLTPARRQPSYDDLILLFAFLIGLPGTAVALALLWYGDHSAELRWSLTLLLLVFWIGSACLLRDRVLRPLRTIAGLLGGLHEGDYSIRGRVLTGTGALDDVFREINALIEILHEQRLGAFEASALLRAVMAEIDVAVFTFDADGRLQFVNRAGEQLLKQSADAVLGRGATGLGLAEYLASETALTVERAFPGGAGRWGVRRRTFREQGRPHQLLVLSDLSRELREEERQAWQRIVRVLGHELNNSLAPIKSIAGSLQRLTHRDPPPADWRDDMQRGLEVIGTRADSLNRFMGAYAQLARLPKPQLRPVELAPLAHRVATLETRLKVTVLPSPPVTIRVDGDQLEQLLINLIRNAADAVLEPGPTSAQPADAPAVTLAWQQSGNWLDLHIEDNGPGLANTANLFVPFFTTKPKGTGIGLLLCRQIAEAHGGQLTLENRNSTPGCLARLHLPLTPHDS